MRLIDLFTDLYRPLRLRGKSPNTTRLYGSTIRTFGRWLNREPMLADLNELQLATYLEHRTTVVAPYTAEKERTQLVALATLAWERRLIEVKPVCPPAPLPERVPVAWSIEQMAHLMAVAEDPATYGRCRDLYSRLFPALIGLIWETGERIGALIDCRREDFTRPHLLCRAEARKGRKRDKLYTLTDGTCDRLEALPIDPDGKLVHWPFDRTFLQTAFGKVVAKAGLAVPGKKRLRFHQIRRSALTYYAAAGGDACAMADHASPKTTQRWYLDPRITDKGQKPCDVLPSIERKQPPAA